MDTTATVAVLFCDLVGSTERLVRQGDEAGDQFRRRFFAALRTCVTDTGGTEVKNLGDGLMVVFEHSTVDALRCAACMHGAVATLDAEDPVRIRVGISLGEVAHEDGDWFGTPVVEAARLCNAATAGQTLAPTVVAAVVGSRGSAHRFRSVGSMNLKGLAAPLPVVEVDAADASGDEPRPTVPGAPGAGRRRLPVVVAAALGAVTVIGLLGLLVVWSDRGEPALEASPTTAPSRSGTVTRPQGYRPVFQRTTCEPAEASGVPDASCGDLVVPESRVRPEGRMLRIPVVRASGPAGSKAPPVIVLDVNEPLASTSLREAADVYHLGLRGFAGSEDPPLTCPELGSAWASTLAQRADDPSALASRVAAAGACAARLRAGGVQLEGYNMAEVGVDVRDLVLALDLGEVSVAAGGFTTPAAIAFARSNPGAVDSLLLTNPTPPGESALGDPAASLARSFSAIVERCRADSTCRSAYPDLEGAYRQRFERLRAAPVRVSTVSLSGSGPFDVLLDGRRYAAALESAMRESARLGLVPSAVLSAGDSLTAAAGIDEDVSFFVREGAPSAAFLSLTCSYDARLNRTAEITDAAKQQFAGANDPTFGRICPTWGVPSVFDQLSRPLDSDVPVLFATGGLSVSGVNGWARSMADLVPGSVVVDVPTMSEDLAFAPPPCLRAARRDFVADPGRPPDRDACRSGAPPIEFIGPS